MEVNGNMKVNVKVNIKVNENENEKIGYKSEIKCVSEK